MPSIHAVEHFAIRNDVEAPRRSDTRSIPDDRQSITLLRGFTLKHSLQILIHPFLSSNHTLRMQVKMEGPPSTALDQHLPVFQPDTLPSPAIPEPTSRLKQLEAVIHSLMGTMLVLWPQSVKTTFVHNNLIGPASPARPPSESIASPLL